MFRLGLLGPLSHLPIIPPGYWLRTHFLKIHTALDQERSLQEYCVCSLSLSKEGHDDPMCLEDQGQVEKAETSAVHWKVYYQGVGLKPMGLTL